ncbi:MAG: FKBP-type peptidyl-prolyl cis-trans isomerase [Fibrella sp.]|nr:FKBP-type peptidyl-prolyl cis-trans isomerase [Armatimonadota bacterium]
MNSTIDRLSLSQSAATVRVGESATFAVSALDAAGNLVLTGATTWQWASSNAGPAPVTANGASATVNSLAESTTTVSVTETESGKTASLPLTIATAPIITTASGLQYQDVVIGAGRTPVTGKRVAVFYIGTFRNGTVFESRQSPADPFIFRIGVGQVIRGWDEGIAPMREGGKRRLFVPAELAYGSAGSAGGTIPPNTPIDFEVDLVAIEP